MDRDEVLSYLSLYIYGGLAEIEKLNIVVLSPSKVC
jgi:hypothetical protein